MTQALKQLQNVNQNAWTGLFPTVSTAKDSLLFVKHLTNLAIPTILFMRKILPESEFENRVFEGMTLKVLKNGARNANTDRIQTWLSGAYDALERNYLKSMSLEIKDKESDLSLEIYTINVMGNTKGASMSVSVLPGQRRDISFREQMSNIPLQTVRLLQMCHSVTKSCSDLPAEVTIFMKLSYQDNVPRGYHPFGYKAYTPSMPIFLKKTRTFEIGIVDTNHHVIEFMKKTCLCDESILPKARKETDENSKETESPCFFSSKKEKLPKPDYASSQNNSFSSQLTDSQNNANDMSNKEIGSQFSEDCSQSDSVRCPCLSKLKTSVMYQCSGCSYWECFGIRLKKVLNEINIFYCQICAKMKKDFHCPDELMIKLSRASDQQKLAVTRRLLSLCNRFEGQEVTFRKLEKVSGLACQKTLLEKVVKHLISLGVLNHKSRGTYGINKNKVAGVMPQFFSAGSVTDRSVGIHKTGQITPLLGKRKLESSDKSDKTANGVLRILPERKVTKGSAKKYFR